MSAGLFLMWGVTGSGKSTHSLALALELGQAFDQLNYLYVLEPRATGEYNELLQSAALAKETLAGIFLKTATLGGKYLVIDSLTYIIPAVGAACLGGQEDVTMTGGLRRSDILGVISIDATARKNGLTVIGTVNSELFPKPQALTGACEGSFSINASGTLLITDRLHRKPVDYSPEYAALFAARTLLGQTAEAPAFSNVDNAI
jgi:hypothetical protein